MRAGRKKETYQEEFLCLREHEELFTEIQATNQSIFTYAGKPRCKEIIRD